MPHGGKHKTKDTPHGSDRHGGGSTTNQPAPAFARSKRYKDAIDIWNSPSTESGKVND